MRRGEGQTLVELVAAVTLVLLLSGIAVLRFSALLPRADLRSAAYRLAGDLRLAQQHALLEGETWELVVDGPSGAGTGYHLYFLAPSPGWQAYRLHGQAGVTLPAGVVIHSVVPPAGAAAPSGGSADGVAFDPPAGSPHASGATVFTLANAAGEQYQVRVRAVTGFVEFCKGTCP